jgi:hypothetical protein
VGLSIGQPEPISPVFASIPVSPPNRCRSLPYAPAKDDRND